MENNDILDLLRGSSEELKTEAYEYLLTQDIINSREVLLTMLLSFYRSYSTIWAQEIYSPQVWSDALAKHLPAIVDELRKTTIEPGSQFEHEDLKNETLTDCAFSCLCHSFCYIGFPPAESLFASLVRDRAFLRKIASTEYCFNQFSCWIDYSFCTLSDDTIDAIMEAMDFALDDEIDQNIAVDLLCHLTAYLKNKCGITKLKEVRTLVFSMLRKGLKLKDHTLENIVSRQVSQYLDPKVIKSAVFILDSLNQTNDKESSRIAIDLLEMLLNKYDPIPSS